jgi:hypothetical protein
VVRDEQCLRSGCIPVCLQIDDTMAVSIAGLNSDHHEDG